MKILVRSLSRKTTDQVIRALFEPFGSVESVVIVNDKGTGISKGFGFVEMPNDSQARVAVKTLNARQVDGEKIRVKDSAPGAVETQTIKNMKPQDPSRRPASVRRQYPEQGKEARHGFDSSRKTGRARPGQSPAIFESRAFGRNDNIQNNERKYGLPRGDAKHARAYFQFRDSGRTGYSAGGRSYSPNDVRRSGFQSKASGKSAHNPMSAARGFVHRSKTSAGIPIREHNSYGHSQVREGNRAVYGGNRRPGAAPFKKSKFST